MLPVCSTIPCSSSHSQVSLHCASRPLFSLRKYFESKYLVDDNVLGFSNGSRIPGICFKTKAAKTCEHLNFVAVTSSTPSASSLVDLTQTFDADCSSSVGAFDESHFVQRGKLSYTISSIEGETLEFSDSAAERVDGLIDPQSTSSIDLTLENPSLGPETLEANSDALHSGNTFDDLLSGSRDLVNTTTSKNGSSLKSSLDTIASSLTSLKKVLSESVDNALGTVSSTRDQVQEAATNEVSTLLKDLKEATGKATLVSVDLLRGAIVGVESSLQKGASFVVYYYVSAKALLSPEIRDALNLLEEKATQVLSPVGAALQQVFVVIEGLERNAGVDPTDPLVPFILFLGTAATLWAFYWIWSYSGYSGDLSPQLTLELLSGKKKTVLIDVRPEDLRERDGIPDLRQTARFRYASVTLPEIDGTVRKLLKGGSDLDNTLIAAVIRNLKAVQDSYKIVVMDADGSCSKGIARSLRKLGIKRPYLVQGGFQSWKQQSLRVKELKPETALTILNEEAEAILEDINPSPVQLFGYGVGFVAALYALIEWEKTLQLIGVIGVGQTIVRRVASYQGPEDFKQDVRLLLTPVTVGSKAISWVAGKAENNRIGLPTSPSSSDVQTRVLQAAAKHESQPISDTEGSKHPSSPDSLPDSVDLKEA